MRNIIFVALLLQSVLAFASPTDKLVTIAMTEYLENHPIEHTFEIGGNTITYKVDYIATCYYFVTFFAKMKNGTVKIEDTMPINCDNLHGDLHKQNRKTIYDNKNNILSDEVTYDIEAIKESGTVTFEEFDQSSLAGAVLHKIKQNIQLQVSQRVYK